MSKRENPRIAYRRWWLGKYCRLAGSHGEFKKVVGVECIGPPSFVYGDVELHFEDGSSDTVLHPTNVKGGSSPIFRPRKKDVEVRPGDSPPPPMERD